MKKLLFILLLITVKIVSQEPKDSINVKHQDTLVPLKETPKVHTLQTLKKPNKRYSDDDLKRIDSLLIQAKFDSPLFSTDDYMMKESEIMDTIKKIVPPDLLKLHLKEINSTTPFYLEYNPALERVINNYLKYRKKYYPALMARAKYYFPMFEQHLDQYDIPLEMKYLAIVESALHPRAKSRVGATGLWQFMYGTGKQFKLSVNSYVDERQDPVKSTIAACKYLTYLYTIFNDWDLSLAAYNSGPGNVLKAIKRSGGYKNYWNIRPFLPIETAGYVPAFYATMYIFKYADELGLHSEKPKLYHFETDTIQIKRTVSFEHISQKTGISDEVLSLLNPKYKIDVIPFIEKKKFTVRLPRNKVIDFLDKETEIYALATAEDATREKPLPKYFEMDKRIRYRVKSGDYLGKIARKFGVRVSQIKRWNNLRSTRLRIGQKLYIYPRKL